MAHKRYCCFNEFANEQRISRDLIFIDETCPLAGIIKISREKKNVSYKSFPTFGDNLSLSQPKVVNVWKN